MGWLPVHKEPGWKELREEENARCLWGRRNPRTASDRVPGLPVVGHLVRAVNLVFRARHPTEVDQVPTEFGTPGAESRRTTWYVNCAGNSVRHWERHWTGTRPALRSPPVLDRSESCVHHEHV